MPVGKSFPSPLIHKLADDAVEALSQPGPMLPARVYLSETHDYGIFVLSLKNDHVAAGWQNVYAVVHKEHDVIAAEAKTLAFAMELMFAAQESIDKAVWMNSGGAHGAN